MKIKSDIARFMFCVFLVAISAFRIPAAAQQNSTGVNSPAANQQQGGSTLSDADGKGQPKVVKKIDKRHYLWPGPGFVPPKPLSTPIGAYPGLGPIGKAVLCLGIGETGDIEEIQVVKSLTKEFDDFAIKTASQWKFSPATKGGKPIPVYLESEFKQTKVASQPSH